MKRAEAITLSKIRNTFSAIVFLESAFVNNMKVMVSFVEAIDLKHSVKFVEVRIKCIVDVCIKFIVDNILTSVYLPTRT